MSPVPPNVLIDLIIQDIGIWKVRFLRPQFSPIANISLWLKKICTVDQVNDALLEIVVS